MAVVVKNLPANARDLIDTGLIPGLGRSPGSWRGNPLQYSCLENPMDSLGWRGGLRVIIHTVAENRTRLKQLSIQGCGKNTGYSERKAYLFFYGYPIGMKIEYTEAL